MTKETLSDKEICVGDVKLGTLHNDLPYYVYPSKDSKVHIQNAQKRLKEELLEHCGETSDRMCIECAHELFVIEKIFKEEFGGKLLK